MGWPKPCFPKEEPKTGNSWGQRGTIWRNPSAPSCRVFPTSVAMERMREEVSPVALCCSPGPAHGLSWLSGTAGMLLPSAQESWHKKSIHPGELLPHQSHTGTPMSWAQHLCAEINYFSAWGRIRPSASIEPYPLFTQPL